MNISSNTKQIKVKGSGPTDPYVIGIRDPNGKVCKRYPIQEEFYKNQKTHRYNVFGGATGSTKTTAISDCAAEELKRYLIGDLPALKIACLHEDNAKALGITVGKFVGLNGCAPYKTTLTDGTKVNWIRGADGRDRLNKSERIMWFGPPHREPCMIYWSGLSSETKSDEDFMLCGYDFDLILWSQMESVQESAFLAVRKRLGRRIIENYVPRMLGDSNPASCWVKDIFVDGDIYPGDDPNEYYFLNSTAEDNLGADKKYLESQRSSPDAKRYYYGLWDDVEGRLYNQFVRRLSYINFEDVPFAEWMPVETFLDYGRHTHPFAALWCIDDEEGNTYALTEDEFYKHTIRQAVDRVKIQRERLLKRICARLNIREPLPLMQGLFYGGNDFNRPVDDESGMTLGQQALYDPTRPNWEGIPIQTVSIRGGEETRSKAFVNSLSELTIPIEGHRHPITGETPAPRFYVTELCPRLRAQITSVSYDPKRIDHVKKIEVRNKFPTYSIDGEDVSDPTSVHHYDLHDCALLKAQIVYSKKPPKKKQTIQSGSYEVQWEPDTGDDWS